MTSFQDPQFKTGSSPGYSALFGILLTGAFLTLFVCIEHGIELILTAMDVSVGAMKIFFPLAAFFRLVSLAILLSVIVTRFRKGFVIPKAFTIVLIVAWPLLTFAAQGLQLLINQNFSHSFRVEDIGPISVWRSVTYAVSHFLYVFAILVATALAISRDEQTT